jgi:predicted Zn-dependent peptidase
MAALVDRTEFRTVLKEIVKCLRQNLDVAGVTALTPKQMMAWFQNVTLQDLQTVTREIDQEQAGPQERAS